MIVCNKSELTFYVENGPYEPSSYKIEVYESYNLEAFLTIKRLIEIGQINTLSELVSLLMDLKREGSI